MWQCKLGHIWLTALRNIKHKNSWCPPCAKEAAQRLGLVAAQNSAAARGGKCLATTYSRNNDKLEWRCAEGHTWNATLHSVQTLRSWCPVCAAGKSEREVRSIFERLLEGYTFPKVRPHFLKMSNGYCLELDGYCPQLKLAFEYQGEQHYNACNYFNTLKKDGLQAQQRRDHLKEELCKQHGIGLIAVPHGESDREAFVKRRLLELGFRI